MSEDIISVNIEEQLRESFLAYSMSVIISRALPDARDGLKPVHRRVLFAMSELNNRSNRGYLKSARIVGDVIGKYHPHGDNAAYDTLVRMAQDFNMRYPLIDGQGNFGSLDGDGAAAMRYTEVRMARITDELLADLDRETVDFSENYDGNEMMPDVLPARLPNLLVNGSTGIAVGMATNIPPHNLTEVINGCLALLDNEDITADELMEHIEGPDFPTGGIINGRAGILRAYRHGRGSVRVRARTEVLSDEKSGRDTIIITEIPYQMNRARLIEKIAELVKDKKIEGISELRDESAADTRIVIELRRGEMGEVVLNNLFMQTHLETSYGINMVALVQGEPRLLNLKEALNQFLLHRREVVTRRTVFLLRRARSRGHILEGQVVALSNIDPVIELIKLSPSPAEARDRLVAKPWQSDQVVSMLERAGPEACRPDDLAEDYGLKDGYYHLSPQQAQAILDLRLNRLTSMEQDKLLEEYEAVVTEIADLQEILQEPERLLNLVREELIEVRDQFGDERRTEIIESQQDLTAEDLITEQKMVVTVSHGGYAKTQPLGSYRAQGRGGRGRAAASVKDEDYIEHLLVASTHDTIMCFTNRGKVYWTRVFQIPVASRTARGRPLVNLLRLGEDERITAIMPMGEYQEDKYIFFATAKGRVKRTSMRQFARQSSVGLIAIGLEEGDELVGAAVTDGSRDLMLFSSAGKSLRINERVVRSMGRNARGVRGIRLGSGHQLISLIVPEPEARILVASRNGFGKRTEVAEFPVRGRGGQGVIAIRTSSRNGPLVAAVQVFPGDELMLISDQGTLVRIRGDDVSTTGRNTQGVKLINLVQGEHLVGLSRIAESDCEDEELPAEEAEAPEAAESLEAGNPAAEPGQLFEEDGSHD